MALLWLDSCGHRYGSSDIDEFYTRGDAAEQALSNAVSVAAGAGPRGGNCLSIPSTSSAQVGASTRPVVVLPVSGQTYIRGCRWKLSAGSFGVIRTSTTVGGGESLWRCI